MKWLCAKRHMRGIWILSSETNDICDIAFRDRNAGSAANRGKPIEERGGRTQGTYEGRGRGRGGRGGRGGQGDRHSRGVAA